MIPQEALRDLLQALAGIRVEIEVDDSAVHAGPVRAVIPIRFDDGTEHECLVLGDEHSFDVSDPIPAVETTIPLRRIVGVASL